MIFASFIFVFWFLPLSLAAYYAAPRALRNLVLTLFSYAFYGWWRPDFLPLIWVSTLVDWGCGLAMGTPATGRRRRLWLVLSLVANLSLLGFFKYANFVVDTVGLVRGEPLAWEQVVLPVGISFYTFQSLSYTIDVYRGVVRPVRSLLDFACYVCMFPQLVAGPIVRFKDIAVELRARRENVADMASGVVLFLAGFAKKVLIADNAAVLADAVFAHPPGGFVAAWIGVVAFAVQIYFDFSGYSDMAIGLGRMFGFHLPPNFRSPYRAESITEFWRRWHISLSTWLRDYLYVSLGGNRHGAFRTYRNLIVTMLLGGLWHGAAWTFVAWGAFHGVWLAVERWLGRRPPWAAAPRAVRIGATFAGVCFGWTLFRSADLAAAAGTWAAMVGSGGLGTLPRPELHAALGYAAVAVGLVLAFAAPRIEQAMHRRPGATAVGAAVVFVWAAGQLLSRDYSPFLYFRF